MKLYNEKESSMRFLALGVLLSTMAFCADPFYFGSWRIVAATVAPWWTEKQPPDAGESRFYVGKTVVFEAKRIVAPQTLACPAAKYRLRNYPADWLFQGSFGEMHLRDKSVDPVKVAASAGFTKGPWKTVETGCANELDYHFIDDNTAAFGLNNYIYILKKQ